MSEDFAGFKSRCCKVQVEFREDVAYGEAKGLYCPKCLEYCEVIPPPRSAFTYQKPVADVPAVGVTAEPRPDLDAVRMANIAFCGTVFAIIEMYRPKPGVTPLELKTALDSIVRDIKKTFKL